MALLVMVAVIEWSYIRANAMKSIIDVHIAELKIPASMILLFHVRDRYHLGIVGC
jgi:hypothetical protein